MAPESATSRIILATCFFFLPLFFLSHHVADAAPPPSFSFDFSNRSKYRLADLRFEGDAALNGDLVDLTCNSSTTYFCSGRMSYNHPVAFYDNNTGEVASFVTTFTFAINLFPNTTHRGDGMTFFISGYPSRYPRGSSSSGLGLTNNTNTIPSGADRFVAIEFDTFNNGESDPTASTDHIGIDFSSLTSVSVTTLPKYSLNGTMTATITFDNATRMLEATLQFDADRSLAPASVKTQLPDQLDALLPPVVSVGFSAATGGYSELHQIHSWSFNSTMSDKETPAGANQVHPEQGEVLGIKVGPHGRALVIGGLVIVALALLLAIWSILSWCRLKRIRDHIGKDKRLEYNDLSIATGRFSNMNKIGEGGFGEVYRGNLKTKDVAVKKILRNLRGDFKDFLAELDTIGKLDHKNVVKLVGWCCSVDNWILWCLHMQKVQLFIVYELVPNGDLHQHLSDTRKVLPWTTRYKIVTGLLKALNYLHHECTKIIVHRDIKPTNILLDSKFNAKLGDFGLSRVAPDSDVTSAPTEAAAGTLRYMDPLSIENGKVRLHRSSDVYSFGIVLLEIAHGKYNSELFRKLQTDQSETFVKDVADKNLGGNFDKEQMERVIALGIRCSEPFDASKRPSLDDAILQFLENGEELRSTSIHQDEA